MLMQLNEQTILSALQAVQDPDLHKNIVELNFVQNLKIDGTKVSFDLVLTTPACPIRDRFKDQCIAIVKGLGASEVEVTLTSNAGRVGDAPEEAKVSFLGESLLGTHALLLLPFMHKPDEQRLK